MSARRWIVAIGLLFMGAALVVWGRAFDGWDQAWRVEVGAALGLLGPLYFFEELLRTRVVELSRLAAESASSYGLIRKLLPPGDARTAVLDSLFAGIRDHARSGGFTSSDIQALVKGDGDMRATALAAMRGRQDLVAEDVLVQSIANSLSGFEQYHALLLAADTWRDRTDQARRKIVDAIKRDRNGYIARDRDRTRLAKKIRELDI